MQKYRVFLDSHELSVHTVRVSAVPINRVWAGTQRSLSQTEEAFYVSMDINRPSTLTVEVSEDFEHFELRPLSKSFDTVREGNRIRIRLDEPQHFTVEIDGTHHALHVFVNPPAVLPQGEMLYFGPGEHRAGLIWLESNQTLYIDEGATVYGVIYGHNVENVRILGRGALDSGPYRRGNDDHPGGREVIDALLSRGFTPLDMKYAGNLVLNHCKNVLVEGIILRDAPMWSTIIRNNSENITIDNIKIIGQWRYNSDGINICTSKNVHVKNSFVRSFDDCIITRGAYLEGEDLTGEEGTVENAVVEGCVLWCDWGKSLETWCGHKPALIRNILFKNNYLIHLSVTAMNITVWYGSSHSFVDQIRYEDIFIDLDEDYLFTQLETDEVPNFIARSGHVPNAVSVTVERLGKMVDLGSQRCEAIYDYSDFDVRFTNISYKNVRYFGAKRALPVIVEAWPDIHRIEHITAENCDFALEGWK